MRAHKSDSIDAGRSVRPMTLVAAAALGAMVWGCAGTPINFGSLPEAVGDQRSHHLAARARLVPDYEPWEGPFELRLRAGRTESVELQVELGWCYAVLAVGGDGLLDIDLHVYRPARRLVAEDTMLDATPLVQHCSDWNEVIEVDVVPSRGRGNATIEVLRRPD